jgi:Xaa-Pro dipeptidase
MTALLGNDFACGVLGGPPRQDRVAQAGEIYILDLGPTYRGYFSDNARSFSVDRHPSDLQLKAHDSIVGALGIVEEMARPGVRCQDIFAAVDQHFVRTHGTKMTHHLGHGVGLQPHEYPHLNPKWDDTLLEGEIFTAEPGLYSSELRGGIRIENQYLVTPNGCQNLVDFPLALV